MQTRKMSFSEFDTMSEDEMRGIMAGSGKPMPSGSMDNLFLNNPYWGSNYYNYYTFIQQNGAGDIPPGYTLETVTVVGYRHTLRDQLAISVGLTGSTFEMFNKIGDWLEAATPELKTLGNRLGWAAVGISAADAIYHLTNGTYTVQDTYNLGQAILCTTNPWIGLVFLAYDIYKYKSTH